MIELFGRIDQHDIDAIEEIADVLLLIITGCIF
jgi:hypothetical protein